ncbi:MAG: hypothetical protein IT200_09110 [Thermoleophilia bacterium]|nr:hypothetical protein [Thermoleophilia bacterium]
MIRRALICSCLAATATAAPAAAIAPASGANLLAELGDDSGISITRPAAAWDARGGRFMVAWSENTLGGAFTGSPQRLFGRFVDTSGNAIGPAFRLGDGRMGPLVSNPVTGEFAFLTLDGLVRVSRDGVTAAPVAFGEHPAPTGSVGLPGLAVNGRTGEYLVTWAAVSESGGREVFAQRIGPDGAEHGPDVRVSDDGAATEELEGPADTTATWNEVDDEYLVAWRARSRVHVRRLAADGTPLGDGRAVSAPGSAPRASVYGGPAVTHVARDDEYVVAWPGGTGVAAEAIVQRLDGRAAEIGADDRPVTGVAASGDGSREVETVALATGTRGGEVLLTADGGTPSEDVQVAALAVAGDVVGPAFGVSEGAPADERTRESTIAYDPASNRFLVAWLAWPGGHASWTAWGRLYVRVLSGGAASDPSAARCRTLPPAPVPASPAGRVRLTEAQLRTNRRIALAALRRAQGVQAWLAAGVRSQDLCQAAIGPREFRTGTVTGYTGVATAVTDPGPRRVAIPPAVAEAPARMHLTAARMLADQRIAQAALRRVAAVEARLNAGLTGADIADGAVGRAQLVSGFRPLYVPAGPSETGSTATVITPAEPRRVRVSVAQMRTNQRISRAALRRAEALIRRLEDGIGADEIRDGSLGAEDLAPGVAVSTIP